MRLSIVAAALLFCSLPGVALADETPGASVVAAAAEAARANVTPPAAALASELAGAVGAPAQPAREGFPRRIAEGAAPSGSGTASAGTGAAPTMTRTLAPSPAAQRFTTSLPTRVSSVVHGTPSRAAEIVKQTKPVPQT